MNVKIMQELSNSNAKSMQHMAVTSYVISNQIAKNKSAHIDPFT
jgi:hypothetical protein